MTKEHFSRLALSSLYDIIHSLGQQHTMSFVSDNLAIIREWPNGIANSLASKPFMMNEVRIIITRKGKADVKINMQEQHIEAGTLLLVGRYVVTELLNTSDDYQVFALSLSDEMLHFALGSGVSQAFDGHLQKCLLPLTESEIEFLDALHHLLYKALKENRTSSSAIVQFVSTFVMHISYLWEKSQQSQIEGKKSEQHIFSAFIRLVNRYATTQHTLDFYANRLCVTPRYMSSIVNHVSGKTAKQWIDEAIVNAVKVQLRYTDKQVAEIAYDMNFPNPSFFCKYFKRLMGMTPLEYRERG